MRWAWVRNSRVCTWARVRQPSGLACAVTQVDCLSHTHSSTPPGPQSRLALYHLSERAIRLLDPGIDECCGLYLQSNSPTHHPIFRPESRPYPRSIIINTLIIAVLFYTLFICDHCFHPFALPIIIPTAPPSTNTILATSPPHWSLDNEAHGKPPNHQRFLHLQSRNPPDSKHETKLTGHETVATSKLHATNGEFRIPGANTKFLRSKVTVQCSNAACHRSRQPSSPC